MNARPFPMTSAPIADVTSLECEIPYVAAIEAGKRVASVLKVDVEDIPLSEQGVHLHLTRLASPARPGHDIETCGSGMDCAQAVRAGLYPAIARLCHADYSNAMPCTRLPAKDYLKLSKVETAFPDLVPLIARQPERVLATVNFQSLAANGSLRVPLALVSPAYLQDIGRGDVPASIADDFDYDLLRRHSSSYGVAAGATQDEALLQGLLAAQEWMAGSRFAMQGIVLRQRAHLRRVDEDSLPPQIQSLMELAAQRLQQPVHLFDIGSASAIPTYLACSTGGTPAARAVSVGAGSTAEHAVTRALRRLLEMQAFAAWKQKRADGQASVGSTSGHQEHRSFPFLGLVEIIEQGSHDTVAFHGQPATLPATLRGRIEQLCSWLADSGFTPWHASLRVPGEPRDVACVQVLLTPFDANGLQLQGLPANGSFAAWEEAANQA